MKKNILLLIAISIFGCSTESSTENQNNTVGAKLIKEVKTDLGTNSVQTINYVYSGDVLTESNEIEANGDIIRTVYNYTDGRVVGLNYYKNGTADGYKTFAYDSQNKLIMSSISNESSLNYYYAYGYNSIDQLIVIQNLVSGTVNSHRGFQYYNTATNGTNTLTETYYNSSNSVVQKLDYESDLKNIPYLNMFPTAFNKITFPLSVQNIAKKTMLNGDVFTYEYTYNGNKPSEVIEKLNGVSKNKTNYTYQ